MPAIYDQQASKKSINVSINSDLLSKAKALNINLSQALEQTLVEKIRHEQIHQWQRDNAAAIEAYNEFVEENGMFSDSFRKF